MYFVPLAELQQFRKGFRDTLQMSRLIFLDPNGVQLFGTYTRLFKVTTEFFIDAFAIEYSHQGSNKRSQDSASEGCSLSLSESSTEIQRRLSLLQIGDLAISIAIYLELTSLRLHKKLLNFFLRLPSYSDKCSDLCNYMGDTE